MDSQKSKVLSILQNLQSFSACSLSRPWSLIFIYSLLLMHFMF